MPRPELRNHGVGWMRAVERLRNGGVPRNPVFLMPATHCSGFCKQIFDTHGEAVGRAAWTLETVKIAMHNLDQREKRHGR